MVLWHGRSCKEMRRKILRTGTQNNSTAFQCRNTMHWRPPIQGRRNGICRRSVKGLLTDCFKCLYWARISRPDILWSVNGPERVTNAKHVWSHTFITHVNSNSIVMWEIQLNNADWDCFKTPILQDTLKTQNRHQVDSCAYGSHTFVPISWMCKKQFSVSHSSTEAENISLSMQVHAWMEFQLLVFGTW